MRADDADLLLRAARDADEPGLITLIGACFGEYPGCVLAVDEEMPELRRIASWHAERDARAWVAEDARGDVVGCVAALPVDRPGGPRAVELKKLYVAPRARRRGLGARLCALVESFAHQRGAALVELWSDTRFLDAHRLYECLGYAPDGRSRELHDISGSVERYFRKSI